MSYFFVDQNIEAPDDFYEMLINAHDGLSNSDSRLLNANLILLLANQVGKVEILEEAISVARKSVVER
ncbi:DUF2783 domain-containing protein [Alphaproteobacteria bacterium]|nr:DUF2783 domain-containing protein [Alphaproteobacteria bacterium]|tara:strand:- start:244 stop:447 length:204 start_codon:yes stop_codon:yes gene_type:complete